MASDGRIVIDVVLEDGTIGRGIADIEQKLGGIGDKGEKSSFGVMKLATSIGLVGVASKAFNMVTSSMDSAIKRVDTLSGFPVVMERMGFSSEVAEQSIVKLKDGIQGLPTTLDGIVGSTQNIALMTNDLEGATDTALALNNAFLASGSGAADAERGLTQYVQMLSKGKVDMQSWNTLQETMGFALNKTAEAFGFTGKSAKNDLYDALQKGTITFDEFNNKLIELNDGVGGFAEIAQASGAGIGTSWANMKTAVVSGTANIIQAIQDVLSDTSLGSIEEIIGRMKDAVSVSLNYIADNIPKAVQAFSELYAKIEPFMPLLTDLAIGVAVAVAAFATYNTVVSTINKVKAAMVALNAVVLANPWAVVAAVAIVAAVMIYRNWDTIKTFFVNLWEVISTGAGKAWGKIKDFASDTADTIKQAWESVKEFFSNLWDGLTETATDAWEGTKEAVTSGIEGVGQAIDSGKEFVTSSMSSLWDGMTEAAINAWEGIKAVFSQIFESVSTAFEPLLAMFEPLFTAMQEAFTRNFEAIKTIFSTAWDGIKEITTAAWELIKIAILTPILLIVQLVQGDFEGMADTVAQVWEKIKSLAATIWEAIKTTIVTIVTTIVSTVKENFQSKLTAISQVMENIKSAVGNAWDAIKTAVVNKVTELVTNVVNKWEEMKTNVVNKAVQLKDNAVAKFEELKAQAVGKVTEMASNVINFFTRLVTEVPAKVNAMKVAAINKFVELKTQAVQTMQQKVNDIVTAISKMPSRVIEWITTTKNNIINPLKEIDLMSIGADIINGLINGIKSKVADVGNAIKGVASTVTNGIKGALDIHSPSRVMEQIGVWTVQGMAQGINGTTDEVVKATSVLGERTLKRANTNNKAWAEMTTEFFGELEALSKEHEQREAKEKDKAHKARIEQTKAHITTATALRNKAYKQEIESLENKEMTKSEIENKALAASHEAFKKYVTNRKDLNELSMVDEAKLWEEQLKSLEYGSAQYIEAYKNYHSALNNVQNVIESENKKFVSRMEEINKNLVAGINKEWDEYNKQYESRMKELVNIGGLFDEFTSEQKYSSDALLDNMQSQVEGLKAFDEVMTSLRGRISNESLLDELGNLTPKSLGDLQALAEMTDEQLSQYVDLYEQKFSLATQQATEELSGLKEATEQNVQAMKEAANVELEALKVEWLSAMQVLTMTTDKELRDLETIGRDAGQGLYDGLASMEDAIVGKARSIADAIKEAFTSALDIHSPSRFMRDFIVGNMAKGFEQGTEKYIGDFSNGSLKLAGAITDNLQLAELYSPLQRNGHALPSGVSNVNIVNRYEFNNTFTPSESTPSEHARKQRELMRDLVYI